MITIRRSLSVVPTEREFPIAEPIKKIMRPLFSLTALIMLITSWAYADSWVISTVAGTGEQGFSGDGGPAMKAQIDNPYVDSRSNGLVYTRNRLRGLPFVAHVSLSRGERSELADAGAQLM